MSHKLAFDNSGFFIFFYHKASACVHALYMPNNGKVLMLIFGCVKVIGAKVPCANVHILYMVLGLQPSGFKRPIGFGQVCPFGTGQGAHLGHVFTGMPRSSWYPVYILHLLTCFGGDMFGSQKCFKIKFWLWHLVTKPHEKELCLFFGGSLSNNYGISESDHYGMAAPCM